MAPKEIRTPWRRRRRRFVFPITILASVTFVVVIPHPRASPAETTKCAFVATQASTEATASTTDEASRRFHIPPQWIRAVMRAESHGDACAVSGKGAIGLMQIMPATYEELRLRHALGADPFNAGDNILAGAAYLSEMFERYGKGGFLAAYNAGPQRYEEYLHGRPLPAETINYVARLASKLGLEQLPAAQISAVPDIGKPSIFVALTEPVPSRKIAEEGAANGESRSGKAVPHPLIRSQQDDKIFARVSHSDDRSYASLRAIHRSHADIFVARRTPDVVR